jgi:azobenzene reductase
VKVLILVGSGDENSRSLHLGQTIAAKLHELQSETEIINLVSYGLPTFNRAVDRSKQYDEKTKAFLDKSYAADAFIWVTPVYHNSYSSILKTALDWQHTKFPGKVVAMASNGAHRAPVAVDHLMIVARSQHLISSPVRVCTQENDYDESFNLINGDIHERIDDFADELLSLTAKVR